MLRLADNQRQNSLSVLDFENDDDLRKALEKAYDNVLPGGCTSCDCSIDSWVTQNVDTATSTPQTVQGEFHRLKVLKSYNILDAKLDSRFERITALCSRIFAVPIALVSFVDFGRQWFLSNHGLEARETPRNLAFCSHALLSKKEIFIVHDASQDDRFKDNALVTGPPYMRFYAGAPLVTPEGFKLGTLCVIDSKGRPDGLTLMEKQNLRELSALVVETLVQRRDELNRMNEDKYKIIACTAHDLLTPLFGIQLNLSLLMDDKKLWNHSLNDVQRDLIRSASSCTELMDKICRQAIESYRGTVEANEQIANSMRGQQQSFEKKENDELVEEKKTADIPAKALRKSTSQIFTKIEKSNHLIVISDLIRNLELALDPYPKMVPIMFEVNENVPLVIKSDEVKVFRSAQNYLTNACKFTVEGKITLRIYKETVNFDDSKETKDLLIFEVDDTGPGINITKCPGLFMAFQTNTLHDAQISTLETARRNSKAPKNIGLGLSSVAANISSLNGDYGFSTKQDGKEKSTMRLVSSWCSFNSLTSLGSGSRNATKKISESGSIFWFSIPIILPNNEDVVKDSIRSPTIFKKNAVTAAPETLEKKLEKLSLSSIAEKRRSNVTKNAVEDAKSKAKNALLQSLSDLSNTKVTEKPTHNSTTKKESSKNLSQSPKLCSLQKSGLRRPKRSHYSKKSGLTSFISSPALHNGIIKKPVITQPKQQREYRKKQALIIDDSLTIRKTVDRALSTLGFEVSQAENGMEGLKQLKNNPKTFDIVICDFLMPIMDGIDCVKQFRTWEENLINEELSKSKNLIIYKQYIIGISAHASPKDAECGIRNGMDSFLPKPLKLATIKEIVNSPEIKKGSELLDEFYLKKLNSDFATPPSTIMISRNSAEFVPDANDNELESHDCAILDHKGPVCLIAEDSKTVGKLLSRIVEVNGLKVSLVENGKKALNLLKARNWDAVFLDDQMPVLNGTECMRLFRAWELQNRVARQNHVYLLSGNVAGIHIPTTTKSNESIPKGFDGAISKPVKKEVLTTILHKAKNEGGQDVQDILLRL